MAIKNNRILTIGGALLSWIGGGNWLTTKEFTTRSHFIVGHERVGGLTAEHFGKECTLFRGIAFVEKMENEKPDATRCYGSSKRGKMENGSRYAMIHSFVKLCEVTNAEFLVALFEFVLLVWFHGLQRQTARIIRFFRGSSVCFWVQIFGISSWDNGSKMKSTVVYYVPPNSTYVLYH